MSVPAYTPTNWADEILNGDEKFSITDKNGQLLYDDVKISMTTAQQRQGTTINADRMNKIEAQIAALTEAFTSGGGGGETGEIWNQIKANVLNSVYPVGSICITLNNTNPATIWGMGTWVLDGMNHAIVGAGDVYNAGIPFGADDKVMNSQQLPKHAHTSDPHSHSIYAHTHDTRSHTHTQLGHSHTISEHTHGISQHQHTLQYTNGTAITLSGGSGGSLYKLGGWTKDATYNDIITSWGGASRTGGTAPYSSLETPLIQGEYVTVLSATSSMKATSVSTHEVGQSKPFNVVQASEAFYLWRRTQ